MITFRAKCACFTQGEYGNLCVFSGGAVRAGGVHGQLRRQAKGGGAGGGRESARGRRVRRRRPQRKHASLRPLSARVGLQGGSDHTETCSQYFPSSSVLLCRNRWGIVSGLAG